MGQLNSSEVILYESHIKVSPSDGSRILVIQLGLFDQFLHLLSIYQMYAEELCLFLSRLLCPLNRPAEHPRTADIEQNLTRHPLL